MSNRASLEHKKTQNQLTRLDRYAQMLDSKFRIPGSQIHFGWDAIIGLIPVVGDVTSVFFSSVIIIEARKAKVPMTTIVKMLINVAVEVIVGSVPLLGDIFDVYWKANIRNVNLLKKHLAQQSNNTNISFIL